jgi:hypothetical protein
MILESKYVYTTSDGTQFDENGEAVIHECATVILAEINVHKFLSTLYHNDALAMVKEIIKLPFITQYTMESWADKILRNVKTVDKAVSTISSLPHDVPGVIAPPEITASPKVTIAADGDSFPNKTHDENGEPWDMAEFYPTNPNHPGYIPF